MHLLSTTFGCFMRKIFLLVALFSAAVASAGEVSPRRAAGDMATEFKNYRLDPGPTVTPLPTRDPGFFEFGVISRAKSMVSNGSLLSIVMVDKGKIVFEAYNAPAAPTKPNFSWSMSKSLVAYTLGLTNCESEQIDYNKPAKTYSKELNGTIYGEASVKDLLMMSSGATNAISSGDHLATKNCKPGIDCDGWQQMRAQRLSGREYMQKVNTRDIPPGTEFRYSATDTLALESIVNNQGGLVNKFNEHIWSKIGAEGPGYWLLDKDNRPVAQAGFSATTRDWARLALYTIKLQKDTESCQGKFIKDATSSKISNSAKRVGRAFNAYGYQTWIANFQGKKSYWWLGFGGQRVGVDPESEKIIVVTSWREDYMDDVYKLLAAWQ